MGLTFQCTDFDDGYLKLNNHLFFKDAYDHERGGITAHKFDVKMIAESPACDLNLHDLNYTYNKWKMLNNLYLNAEELGVFIARIKHYKNQKKHKAYVPDIAMQFNTRRNVSGACLLSFSLGYHNGRWVCNVTSRASELTCRWPMDLIFVNVMLRTIAASLDIDYLKIQVIWSMISTYQSITSMPYFLVFSGKEDWFKTPVEEMTSWQQYTLKRYLKCYTGDSYSNYGVQRRPMEAYRILKGEMDRKQEIWTKDLTLGVVPFKGLLEEDYDEVDILAFSEEMMDQLHEEATEKDLWGKGGYR